MSSAWSWFKSIFQRAPSDSDSVSPKIENEGYKSDVKGSAGGIAMSDYYGALINSAASIYNTQANIAAQKKINAENLKFGQSQLDESIRQYEKNYAQSEYWNEVSQNNFLNATQIRTADMARAGINPLALTSTSDGQTISPAQSSGVSGSSNQQAPRSQIDLSAIAELAAQKQSQRFQEQENSKAREVEIRKLELEEEKNTQDYLLGLANARNSSESNRIREKEVDEFIANNIRSHSEKMAVLNEQKRNNLVLESLKKQGLEQEEAKLALQKLQNDREYQKLLEQVNNERIKINQIQQQIDNEKDSREKELLEQKSKKHWDFVDDMISNIFSLVSSIGSAVVGNRKK